MKREGWMLMVLNDNGNFVPGQICTSEECATGSVSSQEAGMIFGPIKVEFDDAAGWHYDGKKCMNGAAISRLFNNGFNPIVIQKEEIQEQEVKAA